jgi:hypothetical protein
VYAKSGRRPPELEVLADDEGNLERPAQMDPWPSPGQSLSLRGGSLVVDVATLPAMVIDVRAQPPMLEAFVGLSQSRPRADRAVLTYARRWGLLDLCDHQLPNGHDGADVPISLALAGDIRATVQPSGCRSFFGTEPVKAWLYWSRQAAAVLGVASRLREGEWGRPQDWIVLASEGPWVTDDLLRPDLRAQLAPFIQLLIDGYPDEGRRHVERSVVSGAIQAWLGLAQATLQVRWPNAMPEMGFGASGLFGALGLQLLLAVVGARSFAICPGCGDLRAPARGRGRPRLYCEPCIKGNRPQELADARRKAARANAGFKR